MLLTLRSHGKRKESFSTSTEDTSPRVDTLILKAEALFISTGDQVTVSKITTMADVVERVLTPHIPSILRKNKRGPECTVYDDDWIHQWSSNIHEGSSDIKTLVEEKALTKA